MLIGPIRRLLCPNPNVAIFQFIFLLLLATATPTATGAADDENTVESFKVERNGDCLLIPVVYGGQEYPFIVDTGCTTTMFDTSLKTALRPTGEKVPMNGTKSVELYECRGAAVGRSKLALGKWVACLDLADLRKWTGHNIRGILGMDFLHRQIVQIDFDAGLLSILRSSRGAPGQKLNLGADQYGLPTVTVNLCGDFAAPFMIDTGHAGYGDGVLAERIFADLLARGQVSDLGRSGYVSLTGPDKCLVGTLDHICVGPFRHSAQEFSVGELSILGMRYLSRYRVTLDFPGRTLFLAKGKQYARGPCEYRLEFYLGSIDGDMVVIDVLPGGVGYEHGVRAGDRVLEVDGSSADEISIYRAYEILSDRQPHHSLKVWTRAGKERTIDLKMPGLRPTTRAPSGRGE